MLACSQAEPCPVSAATIRHAEGRRKAAPRASPPSRIFGCSSQPRHAVHCHSSCGIPTLFVCWVLKLGLCTELGCWASHGENALLAVRRAGTVQLWNLTSAKFTAACSTGQLWRLKYLTQEIPACTYVVGQPPESLLCAFTVEDCSAQILLLDFFVDLRGRVEPQ